MRFSAIFYYFTLFTHSPGPPYLTRGFAFMLFMFINILVPSPDPPSSLRKPQMSQNADFVRKWPDIDGINAMAQPILGAIDGLI